MKGLRAVWWKRMSSGFTRKKKPEVPLPLSSRPAARFSPSPTCTRRALSRLSGPVSGLRLPLVSRHASRHHAVPMQSFVRSNSGSGLAANRRNRITPRAPILPLTEFSVFLNQRSTKDPHPPSSHSPVGVAGDFWLGSRFRSPTGSTKNCQRTRVVLRLS